jgi:hypothetical protein
MLCQYQVVYLVWAISSCFIETSMLFTPAVRLFDSQNDTSGAFRLKPDCGFVPPPHCARISTPLNLDVALNVKSTGWPVFGIVNVAVTGLNVPGVNAGIVTTAFVALISV